jgi:hypothetical protein
LFSNAVSGDLPGGASLSTVRGCRKGPPWQSSVAGIFDDHSQQDYSIVIESFREDLRSGAGP